MSAGSPSMGYLRRHGGVLLGIGGLSAVGIVASSGFHVVTGRVLGPEAFGLLAAFLAIVNIAAIGAASLQNSVAVATAADLAAGGGRPVPGARSGLDAPLVEALLLGGAATVVVAAFSPWLADGLGASRLSVLLAAATMLPSFVLSVAQGRLQGTGRVVAVVAWSSGPQVVRLVLAVAALAVGLGAVSVLLTVLVCLVAAAAGASWQARGTRLAPTVRPFRGESGTLILLTLAFAWLTNVEVVLVRLGAPEQTAGSYAAGAVLAKMVLLVPTMLSLYLLPRFVARRDDADAVRYGVNVVLVIVSVTGLLSVVATLVVGDVAVRVLFGEGYGLTADLLPWLALAYLPWAMCQGVLIRLTASASRPALVALVVVAVVEAVLLSAVVEDPYAVAAGVGGLGALTLAVLLVLHLRTTAAPQRVPT